MNGDEEYCDGRGNDLVLQYALLSTDNTIFARTIRTCETLFLKFPVDGRLFPR